MDSWELERYHRLVTKEINNIIIAYEEENFRNISQSNKMVHISLELETQYKRFRKEVSAKFHALQSIKKMRYTILYSNEAKTSNRIATNLMVSDNGITLLKSIDNLYLQYQNILFYFDI